MKIKTILAALLLCSSTVSMAVEDFATAKRELPKIYKTLNKEGFALTSFYCGCPLSLNNRNKFSVDLKACGYEVRKQAKRASRIEYEHIMPAWEFGNQLACWRDGGRKNCGKNSNFERMEGDLHNLVPAIGEVNGDRSNFQYSQWNQKPYQYGQCEMIIDFKNKLANPPMRSRGQIASAYLYMADTYNIRLSNQQRRLYEVWNNQYAPDAFECRRNELITKIQGNANPYISQKCK